MAEAVPQTGYAPVNGLKLYYEVHGDGEPLVLIHGGVGGIAMFGPNLSALAATRRVIAVELQGHGHTADIDRPLSFQLMADDIAALLAHLRIARSDVVGYSLGGEVALQVAIRHPAMVRKLVLVSAAFRRDGWFPEVLSAFDHMGPAAADFIVHSPLYQLYPNVNWPQLFTKLGELPRTNYDWSNEVAALKMPTLIVFADADSIQPVHIFDFWGLLGGGRNDAGVDGLSRPHSQLAILPGQSHYSMGAAPGLAVTIIPFLEAP